MRPPIYSEEEFSLKCCSYDCLEFVSMSMNMGMNFNLCIYINMETYKDSRNWEIKEKKTTTEFYIIASAMSLVSYRSWAFWEGYSNFQQIILFIDACFWKINFFNFIAHCYSLGRCIKVLKMEDLYILKILQYFIMCAIMMPCTHSSVYQGDFTLRAIPNFHHFSGLACDYFAKSNRKLNVMACARKCAQMETCRYFIFNSKYIFNKVWSY